MMPDKCKVQLKQRGVLRSVWGNTQRYKSTCKNDSSRKNLWRERGKRTKKCSEATTVKVFWG